jgi:hypothetical protein
MSEDQGRWFQERTERQPWLLVQGKLIRADQVVGLERARWVRPGLEDKGRELPTIRLYTIHRMDTEAIMCRPEEANAIMVALGIEPAWLYEERKAAA